MEDSIKWLPQIAYVIFLVAALIISWQNNGNTFIEYENKTKFFAISLVSILLIALGGFWTDFRTPQIIYLILYFTGLIALIMGKKKMERKVFWHYAVSIALEVVILIWGGFFTF